MTENHFLKHNLCLFVFLSVLICVFFPLRTRADELLQKTEFFVDPSYDLQGREQITAVLQRISDQLYFYLDTDWWDSLDIKEQQKVNGAISNLVFEFENNIYPILTLNYGPEWNPGIDKDNRITILVHPIMETASGYFNSADEYPKAQVANSNEREMIYLNANNITSPLNKSFLAHEFTHLITFNQKDKIFGISEDVWLNEARAEYAPTLVGYNESYQDSYLQNRVKKFLENPKDSLTEWQGKVDDYGVLNLFIHYLIDHYGKEILIDSLQSEKTGIASINAALKKNGFEEDFSQIFTDWTIAVFINNCEVGERYCYLNEHLNTLKVTPYIYYLPTTGESTLSVGYLTKEWAGNWQKIIGGQNSIKLEFTGNPEVDFTIPYIIEDYSGKKSVSFLTLNQSQKGTIYAKDKKVLSLTIIPSIQDKTSDFSENEPSYQFFWSASSEQSAEENEALIQKLLAQIESLKAEIARLQAKIAEILGKEAYCGRFENDLYYGMTGNSEVRCLQQFLKDQGQDIYPEGLVTGNFLSLTKAALIRFQEKYASEILAPLGLGEGTGFLGPMTRAKINQLLGY